MNPSKPLVRSTSQAMVGGVCAGIANWLGWDVTLVRVVYLLATVFSAAFPGVMIYIVLWVVMPAGE